MLPIRGAVPAFLIAAVAVILVSSARGGAASSMPAGAQATLADVMLKQPYMIYPGNPAQMEVLWQLNATATSTLEWGTSTSYTLGSTPSAEYGTDHQHAFTIGGLAPATKYYFRVTTNGFAYTGSFVSAPDPAASKLKFLAYGDTRTNPATDDQVAAAMISAFTADPGYQTMSLFMGDFVNTGNNETYWTNEFFTPTYANIRALLANVPLQATLGNHENSSPVLYTKYFPYPWVGGRYWSFDYGPIHVTVIDQYTTYTAGSAQLQWIANDLAASTKTWKFVLLHEPGWSSGSGHANNTSTQTLIQPLCVQYGVAMVFAGHNHNYCRALVNGVTHVTTGGGGAPLEAPLAGQPNVVASAMLNHFCKVSVDGGVLQMQAINSANGAVIDSFTIVRTVADNTPPVVAVTSPNGGESWGAGTTQAITWTATDNAGVDSVEIDYAVEGGDGTWFAVAHGLANSGRHDWTVPDSPASPANGMFSVRVTALDHAGNAASDTSDAAFTVVDPTAGVSGGQAVLALARPAPNPTGGSTLLTFSLPGAGRARIDVLDPSGRRVASFSGEFGAGAHTWRWNGQHADGSRARAGLYFVRLSTPFGTRTQRLVRLE